MIPELLIEKIESLFAQKLNSKIKIVSVRALAGGCINHGYKLITNSSRNLFLKTNRAFMYPGMFAAEAEGLNSLRATMTFDIPEVLGCNDTGEDCFLLLEFVEQGKRKNNFFELFGEKLAHLHRNRAEQSGLEYDNYIGSLSQSNKQHSTWIDFFIHERLGKQIALARQKRLMDANTENLFLSLFSKLNYIFPNENPSLLHGDLWNGNFLVSPEGLPCLIDPSVYYGFREMDIAITRLFGGFDNDFYDAYQANFPMSKGWEERMDICNLYPLMVHVNLFGGSYLGEVKSILKRYA